MDSIDSLVNDFKNLANRLNYTGPAIEALSYLLAEAVYKEELNSVNTVLESSPSRMKNLNTAIQYAMDEGYSVNRGKNQHITIKNLRVSTNKTELSVHKYDLAAKVGKYNLYYANDYTFDISGDNIVDFVVAREMVSAAFNSNNVNTNIYTDATNKDLTEVYVYSYDKDNKEEPLNYTEIKRYVAPYITLDSYDQENELQQSIVGLNDIDINKIPEYWLCTRPDYSIRLWKYNKRFLQESDDYRIKINKQFYYKSPRYMTDYINPEDIKSIPGFYFNSYTVQHEEKFYVYSSDATTFYQDPALQQPATLPQGYSIQDGNVIFDSKYSDEVYKYYYIVSKSELISGIQYETTYPVYRTDNIEEIVEYVNYTKLSNNVIRSTNDIENITLAFFTDQMRSCRSKIVTEVIEDDPEDPNDDPIRDYVIYIYYTLPLTGYADIDESDKEKFLQFLRKAYYIQHKINFIECNASTGSERKVDIGMTIYYNEVIDENAVINYLANSQKILGKQYEPERLVSELVANFKNINWIQLSVDSVPVTDIATNEYYMFNKLTAIDANANIKFQGE